MANRVTDNTVSHLADVLGHNLASEWTDGPWGHLTLTDSIARAGDGLFAIAKAIDRLATAVAPAAELVADKVAELR